MEIAAITASITAKNFKQDLLKNSLCDMNTSNTTSHVNSWECSRKTPGKVMWMWALLVKTGTYWCNSACSCVPVPLSASTIQRGEQTPRQSVRRRSFDWQLVGLIILYVHLSALWNQGALRCTWSSCWTGEIGLQFTTDEHQQHLIHKETVTQAVTSRILQPCPGPIFHLLCFIWDLRCGSPPLPPLKSSMNAMCDLLLNR